MSALRLPQLEETIKERNPDMSRREVSDLAQDMRIKAREKLLLYCTPPEWPEETRRTISFLQTWEATRGFGKSFTFFLPWYEPEYGLEIIEVGHLMAQVWNFEWDTKHGGIKVTGGDASTILSKVGYELFNNAQHFRLENLAWPHDIY